MSNIVADAGVFLLTSGGLLTSGLLMMLGLIVDLGGYCYSQMLTWGVIADVQCCCRCWGYFC